MKLINLGKSGLLASPIALGVMRITKLDVKGATELLDRAYGAGINFFVVKSPVAPNIVNSIVSLLKLYRLYGRQIDF